VGKVLVGVGGTRVRVGAVVALGAIVAVGAAGIIGVLGGVVSTETQPVSRKRKKIWITCLGLNIDVSPGSGTIRLLPNG